MSAIKIQYEEHYSSPVVEYPVVLLVACLVSNLGTRYYYLTSSMIITVCNLSCHLGYSSLDGSGCSPGSFRCHRLHSSRNSQKVPLPNLDEQPESSYSSNWEPRHGTKDPPVEVRLVKERVDDRVDR